MPVIRRPASGPVSAPRAAEVLPPTKTAERASATTAAGDSFAAAGPGERVFPPGERRRGSWEWNAGAVSSPAVLDALISSQKSAGATELYLNAYPVLGRERFLADALGRTTTAGLAPQLLLGAPDWSDPATRPWLTTSILAPLRAVREAAGSTTPVTLHLDIEPHATGPLTEQKKRDYLDTLDWLRAALGSGFALEVDLPAWYASEQVGGQSFTAEILSRVEGATLMAYERTAAQVLTDVTPTVELAASLGKQVMVAIEVGPQYARVGLGTQTGVRQALLQLDGALASRPGYGGCALHGLDALKLLPR